MIFKKKDLKIWPFFWHFKKITFFQMMRSVGKWKLSITISFNVKHKNSLFKKNIVNCAWRFINTFFFRVAFWWKNRSKISNFDTTSIERSSFKWDQKRVSSWTKWKVMHGKLWRFFTGHPVYIIEISECLYSLIEKSWKCQSHSFLLGYADWIIFVQLFLNL